MSIKIKFRNRDQKDFFPTLQKRVNEYFETRNMPKSGNWQMKAKLIFFLGGFITLYILIILDLFNLWGLLGLSLLLGFFTAFVGFNVSHDAVHGALSSKTWLNRVFAYTFNLAGTNEYMWNIMHNIVHHTYTNIPGHDDDLEPVSLIRLSTEKKLKKVHRYQHWYAFFFYTLTTLSWVFKKDFATFFKKKIGNYENKKHPAREYFILFFSKAVYLFIFLALPMLVLSVPWWQVVIGFVLLHLVQGITLAVVFQLAHVVEGTEFPEPLEDGSMQNAWAIHQVKTTSNFARRSFLANWFFGGLNFQIEHHLFPHICHVHYKRLSVIVKQTAEEFNIRYNEHKTMWAALRSHTRMLRRFGREKEMAAA